MFKEECSKKKKIIYFYCQNKHARPSRPKKESGNFMFWDKPIGATKLQLDGSLNNPSMIKPKPTWGARLFQMVQKFVTYHKGGCCPPTAHIASNFTRT